MLTKMSKKIRPESILFIAIILAVLIPVQLAAVPSFIGNVIGNSGIPDNFTEYWNQVTSENAAKWGSAESSRDNIDWSTIQSHYDYAKNNGFPYKFHVLIWGSQQPSWMSGLSQSEQRAEIEEWISGAGQRFDCEMWDVVNEPLHAKPDYRNALGGDGSTGWDWVITSFELAHQYCNGIMILNDYGIVNDSNAASQYLQIIDLLQSRGLIDAIGVQAHHFNVDDYPASTLTSNLDSLAQTGLGVYVSEFDSQGDDQTQLSNYQTKFKALYDHSNTRGITLWGYIQGQTWRDNTHLVSSGSSGASERPAMQWLKQYLGGPTLAPGETPTPTPTPTDVPTPTPTAEPVDCSNAPEWDPDEIYPDAGMRVVYNGNLYENNWYTQGQNPEENSGEYEVWTLLGSCGTGPTAPPATDTPTPTPTPVSDTPIPVTLGDTNSDGTIDIVDALLTAQHYVGLDPSGFNPGAADTNCDGGVDIVDALLIAQYYVGLISQFC